jgi:hypothetical protein
MPTTNEKAVTELLKSAVSAVNASGAKGELREPAFKAALSLLISDPESGALQQGEPRIKPKSTPTAPSQASGSSGSRPLDMIAGVLKINVDKLRYVYTEKNGEPELSIKSSKLPTSKSAGARDIALLVMAARQAAEIDDYTEAETIRAACKRYGKFDQNNFGTTMASLDNHVISEGKRSNMKRKLTHPGLEEAAELIQKYAAQD